MRLWWRIRGARLTVGVRAIVVDDAGRICLIRHSYRNGWFLPGGGVKTGESLVDAMTRELAEETGITPATNSHPVHGVYSSFLEHKSDHVVVFLIRDWTRGVAPRTAEIAEVRFVDPNELPADTSPATQRRIKEFVTGAPVGHRW
ncbi:MAG: NUDIX domain-containing protein [Actinomycetota bacterium]